jgi:hypothetical protein
MPSQISEYSLTQGVSNHCPVLIDFRLPKIQFFTKRKIWFFKRARWDLVRNDLENTNWDTLLTNNNVDTAVKNFNNTILQACNEHIRSGTVRFTSKDKPWETGEIKIEILKRNRLLSIQTCKTNWVKIQRNQVTNMIRRAKQNDINDQTTKLSTDQPNR